MIQFGEQSGRSAPEQPSPVFAQRQKPSLRSWLILVSGSVLLHLLLMRWVGAAIQPGLKSAAATPIDLVNLPAGLDLDQINRSVVSKPAVQRLSAAAPSHVAPPEAAVPSQTSSQTVARSEPQPDSVPVLRQTAPATALAPVKLRPASQPISRQFAKVIPSVLPPAAHPPDAPPQLASSPASPPASPLASATPTAPVQPAAQAPAMTQPAPTALPLISSRAITLPVPDLSQPQPSQPSNVIVAPEQTLIPNYLTANLAASAPRDGQLTKPHIEVQRFLTNSQLPPCTVTPEVIYFLGKTVALRVTTDETGQVMQTVTEQSSRNLAYDDLATCLVRNWDFKPVVAHSQSVAPEGLVVHITIDRS